MQNKYYAVVTFGTPISRIRSYYRTEASARRDASQAMGSGTCTCVRVYECDTRQLAQSADISEVRSGERIVA